MSRQTMRRGSATPGPVEDPRAGGRIAQGRESTSFNAPADPLARDPADLSGRSSRPNTFREGSVGLMQKTTSDLPAVAESPRATAQTGSHEGRRGSTGVLGAFRDSLKGRRSNEIDPLFGGQVASSATPARMAATPCAPATGQGRRQSAQPGCPPPGMAAAEPRQAGRSSAPSTGKAAKSGWFSLTRSKQVAVDPLHAAGSSQVTESGMYQLSKQGAGQCPQLTRRGSANQQGGRRTDSAIAKDPLAAGLEATRL